MVMSTTFSSSGTLVGATGPRVVASRLRCPAASSPRKQRRLVSRRSAEKNNGGSAGGVGGDGGSPSVISEDVLARLRAAEAEAAALRAELQAAKSQTPALLQEDEEDEVPVKKASRIDGGGLQRETIFSGSSGGSKSWLNEADVGFFTRGSPGEAVDPDGASDEEKAIVTRRLLIGIGLAVAAGAFAVVPTEQLRPKPSRPLFFYLVPVLRSVQLLEKVGGLIDEERYDELTSLVRSITEQPNNLKANLLDAAACLDSPRETSKATQIALDAVEYAVSTDYNKYFESMRTATVSGAQRQQYTDFSRSSAKAARAKLREFIAAMPAEQVEAAQLQVASSPF